MSKPRVLVTTSGPGSRLGEITQFTNKSLVKVGRKPVISYIIELYPLETEFVITTGHFGDQVKEFLKFAYPDRRFIFIDIDHYEGAGSSLTYSMLQAAGELQMPFIYHACDTIVTDSVPFPDRNWIGGFRGSGSSHYASFDKLDGKVHRIQDKGEAINPDYLHIGLVGIRDYQDFWRHKRDIYYERPNEFSLGDIHTINRMIERGFPFEIKEFPGWLDAGNVESLYQAREKITDSFHILDKLGESIFIFDDFVIKFFHDQQIIRDRIDRAKVLADLVPKIQKAGKNFYRYQFAEGEILSEAANRSNFAEFLRWAKKNLWKETKEVSPTQFKKIVYDFYYSKTMERLKKFWQTRGIEDAERIINGQRVPALKTFLKQIDFSWLAETEQTLFHGDFILDNIIKTRNGYCLLDWRQNFGGLLRAGDRYYDLAKLNHNLVVNHKIVSDNLFQIAISADEVNCEILRKNSLVECQDELFIFLDQEKLDQKKVKVLTALIWLNMSPLHHHPFDLFLYYFGVYNLWQTINES